MYYNRIAVVGPTRATVPLATILSTATASGGSPPPRVVDLQRLATTPVGAGTVAGSDDSAADAFFVGAETELTGLVPDLTGLLSSIEHVGSLLRTRPVRSRPLVVVTATLAPSTLASVIRPTFARLGLVDGEHFLLAHVPDRGRVGDAGLAPDWLIGGLHPEAPVQVAALYRRLGIPGRRLVTNGLTAEVVKTLETAFRDTRIALAAEVARYCDRIDVDFFTLRDRVNDILATPDQASWDAMAPATGALLVPTIGVGGRGLPNAAALLWWRALESGFPSRNSLVLAARAVNDASPAAAVRLSRLELGALNGRRIAVLGAAGRAGLADATHSPGLVLANLLADSGADVVVHDPHVPPDARALVAEGLAANFRTDLDEALDGRSAIVLAMAHEAYRDLPARLRDAPSGITSVVDACNLLQASDFAGTGITYTGIGRGRRAPDVALVRSVVSMYRAVARGVANEVASLAGFLNSRYADDPFNRVDVDDVLRLAATCPTGCPIGEPGTIDCIEPHDGFVSGLAQLAADASPTRAPRVAPERVPAGLWFGNQDATVPDRETPWPLTPLQ